MAVEVATQSMAEQLLGSAVELGRRGFRVFPLQVDQKKPAHEGWEDQATTDPTRIDAMWRDPFGEPIPYNIGIATGDGLTVVDVDVKGDRLGLESLEDLKSRLRLDVATFTVRTPSGGLHLYYDSTGFEVRCSASRIAAAIDIRSEGGLVVGPGSTVGEGTYEVQSDLPAKPIAPWFASLCGVHTAKTGSTQPMVDLDTPDAIERATAWLRNEAPLVIADSGNGDHTGYQVACRLKDFGVSESEIVALCLEHFDEEKSHPPQGEEFWEAKASNAYRHGRLTPGVLHPMADFEAEDLDKPESASPKPGWPLAEPPRRRDPAAIPVRRWIVGNTFARNFTSGIIAPGGTGKTQFAIQAALAVATGRSDIIGRPVLERVPVWYWNQEDDMDELDRRLAAAMQHFGVSWADTELDGRQMLFLSSGVERPLTLATRGSSEEDVVATPQVGQIIRQINDKGIGLFIADPLAELHKVTENSNEQMRQVWGVLRRIAVECQCATAAGAHTRKPDGASSEGHVGNVDTLRGGGSQAGVMRTSVTLFEMSEKAAKEHGVNLKDRHLYVRLDDAKTNLFLKKPGATWYKRTSVPVGGLDGQKIGILAPVTLLTGQTDEGLLNILAEALTNLGPGEHKLAAVANEVDPALRGPFADTRNRARAIKELFAGAATVETDRGQMHLRVEDSVGSFLRLDAASSEAFFC
ncbi:bifunctional DNA primase/polymerase [Bosea sp. TND4EK4]|uniref:bifunctional DNA primase/polymerase n=1 Tax=Bosea sp. TND4EK4 TaxID=1907408 RepID=UPI000954E194|nr:bifunctional DNA primase/polymerase [Bosea sp. TND4EK4]SIQ76165.1 Bifunctional DNA primase/polymerase, N-terminal [Bosea sp. TND4EK4]